MYKSVRQYLSYYDTIRQGIRESRKILRRKTRSELSGQAWSSITIMNIDLTTTDPSSDYNRKRDISSFTEYDINIFHQDISYRLQNTQRKEEHITSIFQSRLSNRFSTIFSCKNTNKLWRYMLERVFIVGKKRILHTLLLPKSIHLVDHLSIVSSVINHLQK